MKKISLLFLVVFLAACVTNKPDEKTFVGVEKQELPETFQGNPDQTDTGSVLTTTQADENVAAAQQGEEVIVLAPVDDNTDEQVVEEDVIDTEASSQETIVVDVSETEIVIEVDESENQNIVVETESEAVAVPETSLITIRTTDAERLGVVFTDLFALKNYESMLKAASTLDIVQIVILCSSNNQAVYTDLFSKLQGTSISFYLLFSDYMDFYRNRELIKSSPAIKGVIFWYEYWNFIQLNYKSRVEAFDNYLKQLNIVTTTAKQYGLVCYTVLDWFTVDELKQILVFPLQGLLLAVNDKRIGIAEYIETNIQLVRSTGLPVYWGLFLNYKLGYDFNMGNVGTDNDVIKLMKLYRDDPRFQGIIFLY
ncbi:MAG TPA: hypothetical protein PK074_14465 [Spirochaetales bacterium]|nr:hypothetical protein [Spirochaetales bacterium]HOT58721.1 hypothetical protein [Spirochaetales bacterium]HPD80757.1 hypothetical protein [Spirochaetales bacterium]HQK35923.1 hypothetical protein [Spirochaetales bacterium]HRV27288.1 hypothetical protein [Spirochaetia bacterium]